MDTTTRIRELSSTHFVGKHIRAAAVHAKAAESRTLFQFAHFVVSKPEVLGRLGAYRALCLHALVE